MGTLGDQLISIMKAIKIWIEIWIQNNVRIERILIITIGVGFLIRYLVVTSRGFNIAYWTTYTSIAHHIKFTIFKTSMSIEVYILITIKEQVYICLFFQTSFCKYLWMWFFIIMFRRCDCMSSRVVARNIWMFFLSPWLQIDKRIENAHLKFHIRKISAL